jgi:hypothetical protein
MSRYVLDACAVIVLLNGKPDLGGKNADKTNEKRRLGA